MVHRTEIVYTMTAKELDTLIGAAWNEGYNAALEEANGFVELEVEKVVTPDCKKEFGIFLDRINLVFKEERCEVDAEDEKLYESTTRDVEAALGLEGIND